MAHRRRITFCGTGVLEAISLCLQTRTAGSGGLQDQGARCNIICFHSGQTKRVCRSTLVAEASHLAEAVEAGDWVTALLEALNGNIDLRNWSSVIEKRQRVYVTDAKSVFYYL